MPKLWNDQSLNVFGWVVIEKIENINGLIPVFKSRFWSIFSIFSTATYPNAFDDGSFQSLQDTEKNLILKGSMNNSLWNILTSRDGTLMPSFYHFAAGYIRNKFRRTRVEQNRFSFLNQALLLDSSSTERGELLVV